MSEGVDLKVQGAQDLAGLARRMRAAGQGELRKAMLKEIRAQSDDIVADLRRQILTMSVKGVRGGGSSQRSSFRKGRGKNHGLRRTVAQAVQVKITTSGRSTGVRIRVDRTKLPQDQRKLPSALNRPGGWRHPVFGHRDRWAAQQGREYWLPTIEPHQDEVRRAVAQVLEKYAADLDRSLS